MAKAKTAPKKEIDAAVQQAAALVILNALHAEGFNNVILDSTLMFSYVEGERGDQIAHHLLEVVIMENELYPELMEKIQKIAVIHNGRVRLVNWRMNGQYFSRIAIMPMVGIDD